MGASSNHGGQFQLDCRLPPGQVASRVLFLTLNPGQVGLGTSRPRSAWPGQLGLVYIGYEFLFAGSITTLKGCSDCFVSPLNNRF